jgi:MinD superfamily P-loop ATPase
MRIAVASGKGGTGKTTIAAVLASAAAGQGHRVQYADCDVEAPNGHLLLRPSIEQRFAVTRLIPSVDFDACKRCNACCKACQFGAIVCVGAAIKVNPDLCKSCGACVAACRYGAIIEVAHPVGHVETGRAGPLHFVQGVLDVGRTRSIPVIDAVKAAIEPSAELVILDAPPGVSCPALAAARGADLIMLVAEATPFGLADLTLAADAFRAVGVPLAVVINRSDLGDWRLRDFCRARGLPVITEIRYSPALARSYAKGRLDQIVAGLDDVPAQILNRLGDLQTRRAS